MKWKSWIGWGAIGLGISLVVSGKLEASEEGSGSQPVTVSQVGEPQRAVSKAKEAAPSVVSRAVSPASQIRYDHGDPTDLEQYMLELMDEARAHPAETAAELGIDLNEGLPPEEYITPDPKPPLALNPYLIEAARRHSQWMLDNDVFSHTGENGSDPGDRMQAAGYPFVPPWSWGENIAWRGTTGSVDPVEFVKKEHESLFKSPGHRVNLLDPGFEEVGIGIKQGIFCAQAQDGNWYNFHAVMVTQDFATSAGTPGPFVTGVVFIDRDGDGFYSPGEGVSGVTVRPSRGQYYAVTSSSGGYAFPFRKGEGTVTLTFEVPGLPEPISRKVTLRAYNVKEDLNLSLLPPAFVTWTMHVDAAGRFICKVIGPFEKDVQVEWSSDLIHWFPQTRLHLSSGTATFVDSVSNDRVRFYRLRVLP